MAMSKSEQLNELAPVFKCGIISLICGVLLGGIFGGCLVYKQLGDNYIEIHKTNIGYMVFKEGKIFNLSELKDLH